VSVLAPGRLLLIVFGEVLAGGISIAPGGYLSAHTEQEVLDHRVAIERYEIRNEPDEDRAELLEIYHQKGSTGPCRRTSSAISRPTMCAGTARWRKMSWAWSAIGTAIPGGGGCKSGWP